MGRRAKYLTRVDRIEGARARQAIRSARPEAKVRRQAETRRAYLKKKMARLVQDGVAALPDTALSYTEREISNPEYLWLFRQFREGRDTLGLEDLDIGPDDFKQLTGLPPYPLTMTRSSAFIEEWAMVEAALHGYATRHYLEYCEGLVSRYRQLPEHQLIASLIEVHEKLTKEYKTMTQAHETYARTGQWGEGDVSFFNMKWRAHALVYNLTDMEQMKKGEGSFIATLLDRRWALGRA
ncbi:hypothetical protein NMY22_g7931 [Coprinellus aureogranulatus]|nr:hypothetical protein NMY22_g7931 [Coprinellus aureogranulatus]